jgi:hypothetical protein
MKKVQIVLVAALVAMTASTSYAQEAQPQGQAQGRGQRMAALLKDITLSADQKVKFDSIAAKFAGQRQAMMQDQSLDQDGRRAKMREMLTKQSDEIKAILTDEQKKAFEKNLADMQARGPGGGQRPPEG